MLLANFERSFPISALCKLLKYLGAHNVVLRRGNIIYFIWRFLSSSSVQPVQLHYGYLKKQTKVPHHGTWKKVETWCYTGIVVRRLRLVQYSSLILLLGDFNLKYFILSQKSVIHPVPRGASSRSDWGEKCNLGAIAGQRHSAMQPLQAWASLGSLLCPTWLCWSCLSPHDHKLWECTRLVASSRLDLQEVMGTYICLCIPEGQTSKYLQRRGWRGCGYLPVQLVTAPFP